MGYVTEPMRRRASDTWLSIIRDDEYDAVWNRLREVRPQMSRSELRHHTIYHLRHETGFWERALQDSDIPAERA